VQFIFKLARSVLFLKLQCLVSVLESMCSTVCAGALCNSAAAPGQNSNLALLVVQARYR